MWNREKSRERLIYIYSFSSEVPYGRQPAEQSRDSHWQGALCLSKPYVKKSFIDPNFFSILKQIQSQLYSPKVLALQNCFFPER